MDLSPLADDPELAADPSRNNDFDYTHAGYDLSSDQTHCPFTAHIRKTNPRADLNPQNTINHIIRAGIPYGEEGRSSFHQTWKVYILTFSISVTPDEASSNVTTVDRGLAFGKWI